MESEDAALPAAPQLEHFGLIGPSLPELEQALAMHRVKYTVAATDDAGAVRVHLRDRDGNRKLVDMRVAPHVVDVPRIA